VLDSVRQGLGDQFLRVEAVLGRELGGLVLDQPVDVD
jgi:hypothetical protein